MSDSKVKADSALGVIEKHEHSHEQLHACIGVSLVLGFVFMLLVDQIGSSHVHNTAEGEIKGQRLKQLLALMVRNEQIQDVLVETVVGKMEVSDSSFVICFVPGFILSGRK